MGSHAASSGSRARCGPECHIDNMSLPASAAGAEMTQRKLLEVVDGQVRVQYKVVAQNAEQLGHHQG